MMSNSPNKKRKLDDIQNDSTLDKESEDGQIPKDDIAQMLAPLSRDQLLQILMNVTMESHCREYIYNEIQAISATDSSLRKIFVRDLAWSTNNESLQKAFQQYGEIEEAVVIFDKMKKKSKGYGFVTFLSKQAAMNVLKQQTIEIDGRQASCNLASERSCSSTISQVCTVPIPTTSLQTVAANPLSPTRAINNKDDKHYRRLFVRGLSWDTTDEQLHQAFHIYGEIEEAAVVMNRGTGKNKGFGFVTYKHKSSAIRALKQPNKSINGRTTSCNLANEWNSTSIPHKQQVQTVIPEMLVHPYHPPTYGGPISIPIVYPQQVHPNTLQSRVYYPPQAYTHYPMHQHT